MKTVIALLIIIIALFAITIGRNRNVVKTDTQSINNSSNKETAMSLATSDATFETDVLQSSAPVLVDFWAPWCGPCRMVGPVIDNIAVKTVGKAKVFKLNVDENPNTAAKFGITGIPTVLVFRNGAMQKQFIGVQPEAVYLNALN